MSPLFGEGFVDLMMQRYIQTILLLPIIVLFVILLLSWSFYGELFLSFLPYLVGIYAVYLLIITTSLVFSRYELKQLNFFWFNWLIVFFLFLVIFNFHFDLSANASEDNSQAIKVVSINLWYKNQEFRDMQNFFERENADILMLTEYTDDQAQYLTNYLNTNYPYKVVSMTGIDDVPYIGKAIYSKYPLKDNILPPSKYKKLFLSGVLEIDNKDLDVVMVHTTAPVNKDYFDSRNEQLAYLQNSILPNLSESAVVTGDFNTSPWSPKFFKLNNSLTSNNYSRVRNNSFNFSWYYQALPFFKSQIDHTFLSRDLQPTTYELKSFPGSDHKAQVLTVSWD